VNRYHAFLTAWNAFFSGWFAVLLVVDLFVFGASWMTPFMAGFLVLAGYMTRKNFRQIKD
jgi:hypothetical protein